MSAVLSLGSVLPWSVRSMFVIRAIDQADWTRAARSPRPCVWNGKDVEDVLRGLKHLFRGPKKRPDHRRRAGVARVDPRSQVDPRLQRPGPGSLEGRHLTGRPHEEWDLS